MVSCQRFQVMSRHPDLKKYDFKKSFRSGSKESDVKEKMHRSSSAPSDSIKDIKGKAMFRKNAGRFVKMFWKKRGCQQKSEENAWQFW